MMTRIELRKHCERVIEGSYRFSDHGRERIEEHKLVIKLLDENNTYRRALQAINMMFSGDEMSALARDVLEGGTELLAELEKRWKNDKKG